MQNGIYLTDIAQEAIATAFIFGSAFYQPGNVHKLDTGRHNALRIHDFGQAAQAWVGHIYDTDVGVYGCKLIVGRQGRNTRKGRKKGWFSHIGQPYNTTL